MMEKCRCAGWSGSKLVQYQYHGAGTPSTGLDSKTTNAAEALPSGAHLWVWSDAGLMLPLLQLGIQVCRCTRQCRNASNACMLAWQAIVQVMQQ